VSTAEKTFQASLLLRIGARPSLRVWRQNVGTLRVRDSAGRTERFFHAGPPEGAADLSGIVLPEGWRIEIELKAASGRRTKPQEAWGAFIERSGGVYVLIRYDEARPLEANLDAAECLIRSAIDARRARADG
jgi:hypothetical protein